MTQLSFHILDHGQHVKDAADNPPIAIVNEATVAPEEGSVFAHVDGVRYTVVEMIWSLVETDDGRSLLHASVYMKDPRRPCWECLGFKTIHDNTTQTWKKCPKCGGTGRRGRDE